MPNLETQLLEAAAAGDMATLATLLDNGVDVSFQVSPSGALPLPRSLSASALPDAD